MHVRANRPTDERQTSYATTSATKKLTEDYMYPEQHLTDRLEPRNSGLQLLSLNHLVTLPPKVSYVSSQDSGYRIKQHELPSPVGTRGSGGARG